MIEYSGDWGVIGHEWAVELLRRSIAHDRLRHAYLIGGPSGVGKTALAIGLARTVNCLSETIRPCGKCRACRLIAAHNHVDVTIISAEDKTLKIDQIREMQHTLALHPIEARYRVVILQRFHQANPQAADALLKTARAANRLRCIRCRRLPCAPNWNGGMWRTVSAPLCSRSFRAGG